MAEMEDKIFDIVKNTLELEGQTLENITGDDDLRKHGLNSINSIQLIVNLEKEFKIRFAVHDLVAENFSTLTSIKDTLQKYF